MAEVDLDLLRIVAAAALARYHRAWHHRAWRAEFGRELRELRELRFFARLALVWPERMVYYWAPATRGCARCSPTSSWGSRRADSASCA